MSDQTAIIMDRVNGAGDSVLGTKEGVSNSNRVGEKGTPKKGQTFASFDDEGNGVAHGTNNVIVSVGNGAAVAVSEGLSSDQKKTNQDLVRSESRKRGDPKNGSSWALIVGASSDEDENAGISFRSDTAVADKVRVGNGVAVIVFEGLSSDQKKTDLCSAKPSKCVLVSNSFQIWACQCSLQGQSLVGQCEKGLGRFRKAYGRRDVGFDGASVSGRLNWGFTGVILAQATRIGDWIPDNDLLASDLRDPDPSVNLCLSPYGSGKAMPMMETSTKSVQSTGVSDPNKLDRHPDFGVAGDSVASNADSGATSQVLKVPAPPNSDSDRFGKGVLQSVSGYGKVTAGVNIAVASTGFERPLPDFSAAIVADTGIPKWYDVDLQVHSSHSSDLMDLGISTCRPESGDANPTEDVFWLPLESLFHWPWVSGDGFPALRAVLVYAVIRARTNSDPGRNMFVVRPVWSCHGRD